MTLYELVKVVLDELYREAADQYGPKVDDAIRDRMAYLSAHYAQLGTNPQPINYKDPATRFAYVFKYVAAHGDYIVQILTMCQQELKDGRPLFSDDGDPLRVACIGGGPGSDLIGLLKFLDNRGGKEPVKKVTCYLLDKEQAWADTWTELGESMNNDVALNAVFQPLDVTKPDSWASQKKFLKADLFTMSYFISEVHGLDGDGSVTAFLQMLFREAQSGAAFLFDDNSTPVFLDFFDNQCKVAGLELITSGEGRMTPNSSEQASALGSYAEKFGQSPKIQAYLGYRVLVKP